LSDRPGSNEVAVNAVVFDDWVESKLAVEVAGIELDTFDPDDQLAPFNPCSPATPLSGSALTHPQATPSTCKTSAAGSSGSASSREDDIDQRPRL
jgi:hypothetical protein